MNYILIPLLIVLMGLVVYNLVRGIIAFMQSTRTDLENAQGDGPTEMQLKQNKMMFKRILFQGLAVLVVALLLAASGK